LNPFELAFISTATPKLTHVRVNKDLHAAVSNGRFSVTVLKQDIALGFLLEIFVHLHSRIIIFSFFSFIGLLAYYICTGSTT
jgi:hypothetical protein